MINAPIIVGCILERSYPSGSGSIIWEIEGSDIGDTEWSIVNDPAEELNQDSVTWNVIQEIEISTSRNDCPAFDITCMGANYYGQYTSTGVLDVLGEIC